MYGYPEVNRFLTKDDSPFIDDEPGKYDHLIEHPPEWPLPNVWLGYSASNQHDLEAGIEDLLATPAAVRFLSLEPLVGPVKLSIQGGARAPHSGDWKAPNIDWVIVGAESGPGHRGCDHNWIANLTGQCEAAGVPCFVKQEWLDGKLVKMPMVRGRTWAQFPEAK
jgi:protein gp37